MKEQLVEWLHITTHLFSSLSPNHRRASRLRKRASSPSVLSHLHGEEQEKAATSLSGSRRPSQVLQPTTPSQPPLSSTSRLNIVRHSSHTTEATSVVGGSTTTPTTTVLSSSLISIKTTTVETPPQPSTPAPSKEAVASPHILSPKENDTKNHTSLSPEGDKKSKSSSSSSPSNQIDLPRSNRARLLCRPSLSRLRPAVKATPSEQRTPLPRPPHPPLVMRQWQLPSYRCGAREWIEHVFSPARVSRDGDALAEANARPSSPSRLNFLSSKQRMKSPRSADFDPNVQARGVPFAQPSEPVDAVTGRRAVFFARSLPPVAIEGEKRERFIGVVMRATRNATLLPFAAHPSLVFLTHVAGVPVAENSILSSENNGGKENDMSATSSQPITFGTVLGYSNDNRAIVWQCRTQRYATRLFIDDIDHIYRAVVARCVHCGQVILRTELIAHMQTHLRGEGIPYGIITDDDVLGTACGDTGLLRRLCFVRHLGEGAQGVVDLYTLASPHTPESAAQASSADAANVQDNTPAATPTTTSNAENNTKEEEERETGTSADVRAGKVDDDAAQQVVVKTMSFESSERAWESYRRAVRLMTSITHPHLVQYLAVQLLPEERTVRLVMPFYREGDLLSVIRGFRGSHFDEDYICSVALQITEALVFLHDTTKPPVVHGDVKMENLMLYNGGRQVVLMDFDASGELRAHHRGVRTHLGTTAYMAPEVIQDGLMMPASDMWSLGVLLYVFTVLPDFPMLLHPTTMEPTLLNAEIWRTESSTRQTSSALAQRGGSGGERKYGTVTLATCLAMAILQKGFSPELTELIVDLLNFDPAARPTALAVKTRLTDMMVAAIYTRREP